MWKKGFNLRIENEIFRVKTSNEVRVKASWHDAELGEKTERQKKYDEKSHECLTRTVGVFLQLSVSRRRSRRAARRGAAAPLRTVHPAVGDPAHLLEDRANESNAPPSTAVDLPERQTQSRHLARHYDKAKLQTLLLSKRHKECSERNTNQKK